MSDVKNSVNRLNDKICPLGEHCNTLQNDTDERFRRTLLTLGIIVIVRVVAVGLLFALGILPVYYMYFPLMAVIEGILLFAEAVILFRRAGIFALIMLLHLLVFIPVLGILAFIPWSLVGILLYGLLARL